MTDVTLHDFIGDNRVELIRRCRAKVATRSAPTATHAQLEHGVPMFLDQLLEELRDESSRTREIRKGAVLHGRDLLLQGFTVSQVVHDYRDVCQAVTELAVELDASISIDDFRKLNKCLNDAITSAIAGYAHDDEVTGAAPHADSAELLDLINHAIEAFELIAAGTVGVGSGAGYLVRRDLIGIRDLIQRRLAEIIHSSSIVENRSSAGSARALVSQPDRPTPDHSM